MNHDDLLLYISHYLATYISSIAIEYGSSSLYPWDHAEAAIHIISDGQLETELVVNTVVDDTPGHVDGHLVTVIILTSSIVTGDVKAPELMTVVANVGIGDIDDCGTGCKLLAGLLDMDDQGIGSTEDVGVFMDGPVGIVGRLPVIVGAAVGI